MSINVKDVGIKIILIQKIKPRITLKIDSLKDSTDRLIFTWQTIEKIH